MPRDKGFRACGTALLAVVLTFAGLASLAAPPLALCWLIAAICALVAIVQALTGLLDVDQTRSSRVAALFALGILIGGGMLFLALLREIARGMAYGGAIG